MNTAKFTRLFFISFHVLAILSFTSCSSDDDMNDAQCGQEEIMRLGETTEEYNTALNALLSNPTNENCLKFKDILEEQRELYRTIISCPQFQNVEEYQELLNALDEDEETLEC